MLALYQHLLDYVSVREQLRLSVLETHWLEDAYKQVMTDYHCSIQIDNHKMDLQTRNNQKAAGGKAGMGSKGKSFVAGKSFARGKSTIGSSKKTLIVETDIQSSDANTIDMFTGLSISPSSGGILSPNDKDGADAVSYTHLTLPTTPYV